MSYYVSDRSAKGRLSEEGRRSYASGARGVYFKHLHSSRDQLFANSVSMGLLIAAHIPLGMLIRQVPAVATVHALAAVAIGLWIALTSRSQARVAYAGAYMVGAELIWRIADASVFYELGKYGIASIFIVGMLKVRRPRNIPLPLLYFLLLVPSTILTISEIGFTAARQPISSNLSGPFALMVSAWFFSQLQMTRSELRTLLVTLIAPVLGVAVIAIANMANATNLTFTGESSVVASGGFGPNQVSAALGLASLFSLLYVLDDKARPNWRVAMLFGTLFFATMSALTLSRGGLYDAAAGATMAAIFLMRDARSRLRMILVGGTLFLITIYVLLPRLDEFTKGALSTRFSTTATAGRDQLVTTELGVWLENPLFGVGPGRVEAHARGRYDITHTEYTRLPAAHGIFGIISLVILVSMSIANVRRQRTIWGQAIAAALLGWGFLFMLNTAMRTAAPAFAIGLSFAYFLPQANTEIIPHEAVRSGRRRRSVH